jgi:hypothetical protein
VSNRASAAPDPLSVGKAQHAFDHLGSIGEQAEAALGSGANILYVTGIGGLGYGGIPPEQEWTASKASAKRYLEKAHVGGMRLAIGYVCATSIVKLKDFDAHWLASLRSQMRSLPAEWLQKDAKGKPLPSWYGGDYSPACMSNPDWQTYERWIIAAQLDCGCDGIFFDNPTVHPQGCYCEFCMQDFAKYLAKDHSVAPATFAKNPSIETLRAFASSHPDLFLRFRCTIAPNFFRNMRAFARKHKAGALITANNSLNSADVLYSQCRAYAYNIFEMSQAEDFVVVEDMSSQPRMLPGGAMIEYGPMYKILKGISHGKPVAAVTIADSDYHTAPNLMRLAMAEASANGGSYLMWPTWPESQRQRMIQGIAPETSLLKSLTGVLNDGDQRSDVVLFLPFRNWLQTNHCAACDISADLTRQNIQYTVIAEDALSQNGKPLRLPAALKTARCLVANRADDFIPAEKSALEEFKKRGGVLVTADQPDWRKALKAAIGMPGVSLTGPSSVRVTVFDQPHRTIVHLINLNVIKKSSFEDTVQPAKKLTLSISTPFKRMKAVKLYTADSSFSSDAFPFQSQATKDGSRVTVEIPELMIQSVLVLQER